MTYKISDLFIGLLFAGLIIGTGSMQTHLKNMPQVLMLIFGALTLGSFLAKPPFRTSIPFLVLFGAMLFMSIALLTDLFVNAINPEDGWIIDSIGERRRVMGMNWIWAILAGLVLAPASVFLYYKRVMRNRALEIALTAAFILSTAVIYALHEIL